MKGKVSTLHYITKLSLLKNIFSFLFFIINQPMQSRRKQSSFQEYLRHGSHCSQPLNAPLNYPDLHHTMPRVLTECIELRSSPQSVVIGCSAVYSYASTMHWTCWMVSSAVWRCTCDITWPNLCGVRGVFTWPIKRVYLCNCIFVFVYLRICICVLFAV